MLPTLQWSSGEPIACAESNVDNGRNRCAEGEALDITTVSNGVATRAFSGFVTGLAD
jgi:hypothetical protein